MVGVKNPLMYGALMSLAMQTLPFPPRNAAMKQLHHFFRRFLPCLHLFLVRFPARKQAAQQKENAQQPQKSQSLSQGEFSPQGAAQPGTAVFQFQLHRSGKRHFHRQPHPKPGQKQQNTQWPQSQFHDPCGLKGQQNQQQGKIPETTRAVNRE